MSTSVRMTGNLLLDAMAPEERDGLLGPSTPVPIESGKVYYAAGDWVGTAYFPTSGVLSITAPLDEDEFQVEEASVGREGFIVAQAVLGSEEVGPETYMG